MEFSSLTQRNPLFHPFVLFQAMRSGSVWFTWLECGNDFALFTFTAMQSLLGDISLSLVIQIFTTMLAKRGTAFVRGCIGYHFDGLLSQLLVALHPLVLFIAMWLTSEDAGYDWVGGGGGGGGGGNRVYCACSGPWPFNLSFPVVLFVFDWVGVLWPQLSKVLKLVRWARRVLFPTVSLARQAACLFAAVVWTPMCWFRGEPTLFPGWCK